MSALSAVVPVVAAVSAVAACSRPALASAVQYFGHLHATVCQEEQSHANAAVTSMALQPPLPPALRQCPLDCPLPAEEQSYCPRLCHHGGYYCCVARQATALAPHRLTQVVHKNAAAAAAAHGNDDAVPPAAALRPTSQRPGSLVPQVQALQRQRGAVLLHYGSCQQRQCRAVCQARPPGCQAVAGRPPLPPLPQWQQQQ